MKKKLLEYIDVLDEAVKDRSFTKKTVSNIKKVISLRLSGAPLWLIAKRLKISIVRSFALEKDFMEVLDKKKLQSYKKQVQKAKKDLRKKMSDII